VLAPPVSFRDAGLSLEADLAKSNSIVCGSSPLDFVDDVLLVHSYTFAVQTTGAISTKSSVGFEGSQRRVSGSVKAVTQKVSESFPVKGVVDTVIRFPPCHARGTKDCEHGQTQHQPNQKRKQIRTVIHGNLR
jgi:hypothetical protein